MTYADKLKDPRWQRLRLEVFDRDNWECKFCGDAGETLHVHHKSYSKTGNPWDSSVAELITLCVHCHGCIEVFIKWNPDNRERSDWKAIKFRKGPENKNFYMAFVNKAAFIFWVEQSFVSLACSLSGENVKDLHEKIILFTTP